MPSIIPSTFCVLALTLCPVVAGTSKFLIQDVSPEASRHGLFRHLQQELGGQGFQALQHRASYLEEVMRSSFRALPKNSRGGIDAPSARLALHRLFQQAHGLQIKGLVLRGGAWHQRSPVDALGRRASPRLKELFQEHLSSYGFDLPELALLAASLEQILRSEAGARLRATLQAFSRTEASRFDRESAMDVMEAYMAAYIMADEEVEKLTPGKVLERVTQIEELYPHWDDLQETILRTADEAFPDAQSFDFDSIVEVVSFVITRLGLVKNQQWCQDIKSELAEMEEQSGNGRVRLGDFYAPVLSGAKFEFSENVDYLRKLGALDESSSAVQRLIIPNYLTAPSNCVGEGYSAICCLNECEEIMSQLEEEVQAPQTSPEHLLRIVSAIPSPSVPANRSISPQLQSLLQDVARQHQGQVPIHGRLFKQWMHYAYPRECPFPHLSGTTLPVGVGSYEQETGMSVMAENEEMLQHLEASRNAEKASIGKQGLSSGMWTLEEEMLVPEGLYPLQSEHGERGLSGLTLCGAVTSATVTLVNLAMHVSGAARPVSDKVHSV